MRAQVLAERYGLYNGRKGCLPQEYSQTKAERGTWEQVKGTLFDTLLTSLLLKRHACLDDVPHRNDFAIGSPTHITANADRSYAMAVTSLLKVGPEGPRKPPEVVIDPNACLKPQ